MKNKIIFISVEGDNAADLVPQIENLLGALIGAPVRTRTSDLLIRNLSDTNNENKENITPGQSAPVHRENRRGRPKKEKPSEVVDNAGGQIDSATCVTEVPACSSVANTEDESSSAPSEKVAATSDDVYKALKSVHDSKGVEVAQGLVKEFGGARISDIKPEQFTDFIGRCAEACK